eukprot:jgi/Hompol1/5020/HPOL_004103-RA
MSWTPTPPCVDHDPLFAEILASDFDPQPFPDDETYSYGERVQHDQHQAQDHDLQVADTVTARDPLKLPADADAVLVEQIDDPLAAGGDDEQVDPIDRVPLTGTGASPGLLRLTNERVCSQSSAEHALTSIPIAPKLCPSELGGDDALPEPLIADHAGIDDTLSGLVHLDQDGGMSVLSAIQSDAGQEDTVQQPAAESDDRHLLDPDQQEETRHAHSPISKSHQDALVDPTELLPALSDWNHPAMLDEDADERNDLFGGDTPVAKPVKPLAQLSRGENAAGAAAETGVAALLYGNDRHKVDAMMVSSSPGSMDLAASFAEAGAPKQLAMARKKKNKFK